MALDMTTALTIRAKVDGLGQISGLAKGLGGVTESVQRSSWCDGPLAWCSSRRNGRNAHRFAGAGRWRYGEICQRQS
jgi:hypothetical protein